MKKFLILCGLVIIFSFNVTILEAEPFKEDELEITWLDNGFSIIDQFREGLVPIYSVELESLGFMDSSGNIAIPFNADYTFSRGFTEGLAAVENKDGKWGYVDKSGKLVIPCVYELAGVFFNGVALVNKPGEDYILIDKTGKTVDFNDVADDTDTGYPSSYQNEDGLWGYVDKENKIIIPCKYTYADEFSDGLALVWNKENKAGYIDMSGNEIIPHQYTIATEFKDGMAIVVNEKELGGAIDKKGNVLIPFKYTSIKKLSDGLIAVSDENYKHGYIDKEGNTVIPFIFTGASDFNDGYAIVSSYGTFGIIKNPTYQSQGNKATLENKTKKVKAISTTSNLSLDGKKLENMEVYLIEGNNYFKLRDVAALASKTASKFSLEWNGEKRIISMKKGGDYQPLNTDLKGGDKADKQGALSNLKVEIDDKAVSLDAYIINNQTYYKIRDLARELDFKVQWNESTRTAEITMTK